MGRPTLKSQYIVNADGTITLELSRGYTTIIDAIDADIVGYKWSAGISSGKLYAYRNVYVAEKRTALKLHRLIMERMLGFNLGRWDLVDHVDLNSLNNVRSNLRLATNSQNLCNRKMTSLNKSGYKGVQFYPNYNKWLARVGFQGRKVFVGYFDTPEAAYAAYCLKAKELHGEFFRP